TLLAAFDVLLYRYSGQADLCVGTRIAGRSQVASERLIGFFLNALVLRSDLSGNPTFRQLLGRVRETALGAYAHQELPFEKLVQELRPERSLSHQPLFQVMFVLQNAPMPPLELPNLTLRPLKFGGGTAKLDLDFAMIEEADGLSGLLEYNTDIFSAATIRRMLDHFQVLLAAIVADPDQRIDLLPLLTEAERHTLLVEWNATAADYPRDRCIHELFGEQARRTPDAVAIICRDQRLTFAELDRLTSQVAHRLQALGVHPETPVGVLIERSLKTVVALLGILKAGGCYVPLDPAYPPSHLAFVLADTRLPVLIAEERLRGLVQLDALEHQVAVLPVDDSWSAVASEPTHPPITTITPDNLFYIMYTSGSTGQPKGVVVAQRQLLNRFAWMWRAYPFATGEVMCQRTTVNFTVSIWELLGPMLRGVPTVVIPDEVVKDARAFVEALAEARVTRIVLVPSLLQMILDSGLDLARLLARLTLWSVCGEALSPELVQRFRELLPHAVLLNQYGASEMNDTAVFDTRLQPADQSFVPLGRPIPNLQIYLLDHQLQPVPIGVPGALHVGSVSLARGYLNRPDLTADKFIPHPFGGLHGNPPGSRLYNTGDLARYHADGTLEYLGRRDHQVKIRGVRVELGEIEAVLKQHPSVQQAVVVARTDGAGQKQIAAYVVPKENQEPRTKNQGVDADGSRTPKGHPVLGSAELRQHLGSRLPTAMVPATIVLLDALPRTPNGKVDRKALPSPEAMPSEHDEHVIAPRTEVEGQLAEIMRAVLRREQIGIFGNFFDLGGHSLLATQVISRIRDAFGINLPLQAIFETPTIAGLAEQIERGRREAAGLESPLLPVSRDRDLPLSFAQQRLWFLDQLEPNNPFYNVPAAVRLTGALDVAALQQSLDALVRRHETLRTTFGVRVADLGIQEPAQVIAPTLTIDLPVVDLQALAADERAAEVERITIEESRRPFDLLRGPLIRASLLRLASDEHVLLLTLHHIISDGWSTRVLIRDLTACYAAFGQGIEPQLPALPIQYADYAIWQRGWLAGEMLESQVSYWRRQLADLPLLDLPTDYPRPAIQDFRGTLQSVMLPRELTAALRELSQREGTTLFMTLLAAFNVLLGRYSGQTDIVVGAPIAGRTRAETEPLIGFFANTLVLRTDLAEAPTFRDLLGRVRGVALEAYAHQDVPFEKLVEVLQPPRDLSRNPFFDVLFNYMDAAQLTLEAPGLTLTPIQTELGSKFTMTLYVDEYADAIGLRLLYQRSLFAPERIALLLDHFGQLLAQ
ncbi:MAG TPA: amino acid adenylation domain-containing protein, partial [Herpetosiphonaceae bacterium]